MKRHIPFASIVLISLLTHLAFFGNPAEVVFDEVHFGKFMTFYFSGQYYYDIHPPLGKMLYALLGWLAGIDPSFTFTAIGNHFPDHTYLVLRALPTFAGVLLPIVIWGLARELGIGLWGAWLAAVLAALDNALVAQSRFILLDSFLLIFGFTALWAWARYRRLGKLPWLVAAAVFGGLAMSIKWTGIGFLGVIGLMEAGKFAREPNRAQAAKLGMLAVLPLLVYYLGFAVHFALLPKSGPGDAFMTAPFQKTLEGNKQPDWVQPMGPLGKFVELNREMWRVNATITAGHQYASKWYGWPFMFRPIYYWTAKEGDDIARIYLFGNPLVWWATAWAMAFLLINLPARLPRYLAGDIGESEGRGLILALAFIVNFVPFMFIGRIMFLYHYLPALCIALLVLGNYVDGFRRSRELAWGLAGAAAIAFVYFAPLTYGLALDSPAYESRVWMESWR